MQMLRYLSNRKIFEKRICQGQYSLRLYPRTRIFLSILLLSLVFFLLRSWSNKIKFGQYTYTFSLEKVLERRASRFHDVTVAESSSLRMLRFDSRDIQGVIDLVNPNIILHDYMRLHLLCLLWNPEPERILVIGLGVGILPQIFHYFSRDTIIDVVEIDPVVIHFAQKYFDFNANSSTIRLHAEDGRRFVERQRSNQYSLIIVDVFTVQNRIPHALRTVECFVEYLRILKPTGLVSANFPYEQESRYQQTYANAFFKRIYRGIAKDNYILIGLNKDVKIFNQTTLKLRANTFRYGKPLPGLNWAEELDNLHEATDDRLDASASVFTDQLPEDFLGLSERRN